MLRAWPTIRQSKNRKGWAMDTEREDEAAVEIQEAPNSVQQYSPIEAALAELRQKYGGKTWNLSVSQEADEARSVRRGFTKLRSRLEATRKALKRPALDWSKTVDREAARIESAILEVESPIDEQIRAHEAKKLMEREARAKAEADRIDGLRRVVAEMLHDDKMLRLNSIDIGTLRRLAEEVDRAELPKELPHAILSEAERMRARNLLSLNQAIAASEQRAEIEALRAQRARESAEKSSPKSPPDHPKQSRVEDYIEAEAPAQQPAEAEPAPIVRRPYPVRRVYGAALIDARLVGSSGLEVCLLPNGETVHIEWHSRENDVILEFLPMASRKAEQENQDV
jgi:hypothetical protein